MKPISDSQLDQWLKQAYPSVEVSPDFRFQLWRRLMQEPVPARTKSWVAMAAAVGIAAGLWNGLAASTPVPIQRMDLFGNAPHDSLAGAVLAVSEGAQG